MKVALISYHKNIQSLYPKEWIDRHRETVINQSYQKFDIFELEYGGGQFRIFNDSFYESNPFDNFVQAMNYLLDKVFALGYDCVGNLNADDYYSPLRIETQLPYIAEGYDIVSSNFCLIDNDKIVHYNIFDQRSIIGELSRDHNIIAHPVVMYNKKFWKKNRYIPEQIPFEDMKLWQRGLANGCNFIILKDILLYHRLHNNSVCQSQNR